MTNKVLEMESNSDELLTTTKIMLTTPSGNKIAFYSSNVINEIIANIREHETKYDMSSDDAICKTCNKITFNSIYRIIIKCLQGESDKGILEKLSEDQDTLLKTCSEWDKAIEKRGYVE